jgi:6-pyruvoyl-tetrahydropterin synthase
VRLKIRHNMEIAHRLLNDDGKCQNIHGHGMQVELTLLAALGVDGMAIDSKGNKLEFGRLKKEFRTYIDSTYDHRLVLNREDPWTGPIMQVKREGDQLSFHDDAPEQTYLPGLSLVDGDPTVENLAMWIAERFCNEFQVDVICRIDETKTNGAEAMYNWNGFRAMFAGGAR